MQSLGSFNSCSKNVKKLLKGPWGSIFLPNKNFTFVQYCAFTLIIYPLEIILCSYTAALIALNYKKIANMLLRKSHYIS